MVLSAFFFLSDHSGLADHAKLGLVDWVLLLDWSFLPGLSLGEGGNSQFGGGREEVGHLPTWLGGGLLTQPTHPYPDQVGS